MKARFLSLARVVCIKEFMSGWFHGAHPDTIGRGNVEDFVAYGFYTRTKADLPREQRDAIEAFVREVERRWGVTFAAGRNPALRFMAHLWEPLRVIHKPLALHAACEAATLTSHAALWCAGFRKHHVAGFDYWYREPMAVVEEEKKAKASTTTAAAATAAANAAAAPAALSLRLRSASRLRLGRRADISRSPTDESAGDAAATAPAPPRPRRERSGGGGAARETRARASSLRSAPRAQATATACGAAGTRSRPWPGRAGHLCARGGTPPGPRTGSRLLGTKPRLKKLKLPLPRAPPPPPPLCFCCSSTSASAAGGSGRGGARAAPPGQEAPRLLRPRRRLRPRPLPGSDRARRARRGRDRPLVLLEVPHVSLRFRSRRAQPVDDVAAAAVAVLARHGHDDAAFVAHSYGTFCVSRICQLHRRAVAAALLVDPVCCLTCYPHLLFNFVYKIPSMTAALAGGAAGALNVARFLFSRD